VRMSPHIHSPFQKCVAEFFGTFILVFVGTSAIVIQDLTGAVTPVGIALSFGLVVLALIYTTGEISGAHLNPAVTIAFWAAGRFSHALLPGYVMSQLAGAICASSSVRALLPTHQTLGATLPAGTAMQSFIFEIILTWFLMWVILSVSTGSKEKGFTAGIAVGSVVGLEALFAGPISGASMNPARSLAPAIVSGTFEGLWVYVSAPILGALLAVPLSKYLQVRRGNAPGALNAAEETI
jgi:aquaporin NIP